MTDGNESKQPLSRVTTTDHRPIQGLPEEVLDIGDLNADRASDPSAAGRPVSLRALVHYRWSIIGVFFLLTVVTVSAVWLLVVPKYTATASIEVSPVLRQLTGESDKIDLYESYRQSQVDHIVGPAVLNRVVDREEVKTTNWYAAAPESPAEHLLDQARLRRPKPPRDRLFDDLSVVAPPRKQLIVVSMTTPWAGEAKRIVDAVTEEYARFENDRASTSEHERLRKLESEIEARQRELSSPAGLESEVEQLRRALGTSTPEGRMNERLLRLDQLHWRMRDLETQLDVARLAAGGTDEAAPVAAQSSAGAGSQPATTEMFAGDQEWQRLNEEYLTARRDVEQAPDHLSARHPVIVNLQKRLATAEKRLRERESQLTETGPAGVVVSGETAAEMRRLRVEISHLKEDLATEEAEYEEMFNTAEKFVEKSALIVRRQGALQKLQSERERLLMNLEVMGRVRTWQAYEPSEPTSDKRVKYSAAAVVGSLFCSLLLATVRLRFNTTVNEAREVWRPADQTFLGYLPLRKTRNARQLAECPVQAESVRMVRTALVNQLDGKRSAAIQISSATVGAGKSTLANLLARSFAQLGKHVLLVEADIRRPTLAERFALEPTPGLMNMLIGGRDEPSGIQPTEVPNLSVLPAGQLARNEHVELLANGVFGSTLSQWREQFDMIILDGAPMLGTADGAILSRHVDGTIMVVRERHCRREELVDALAVLSSAGGRLLGSVFVGSGRSGSYGYGYGYGYAYGSGAVSDALDARRSADK